MPVRPPVIKTTDVLMLNSLINLCFVLTLLRKPADVWVFPINMRELVTGQGIWRPEIPVKRSKIAPKFR